MGSIILGWSQCWHGSLSPLPPSELPGRQYNYESPLYLDCVQRASQEINWRLSDRKGRAYQQSQLNEEPWETFTTWKKDKIKMQLKVARRIPSPVKCWLPRSVKRNGCISRGNVKTPSTGRRGKGDRFLTLEVLLPSPIFCLLPALTPPSTLQCLQSLAHLSLPPVSRKRSKVHSDHLCYHAINSNSQQGKTGKNEVGVSSGELGAMLMAGGGWGGGLGRPWRCWL